MAPTYFKSPAEFGKWLAKNHARYEELWVGYYKKGTGKPSLTWAQSVAEALCYGWIDGLRKSVDDDSYMIRFTPRRPGSTWSAVNIRTANLLIREGRMRPAGLVAFQARRADRSETYSYENRLALAPELIKRLKANKKAWTFFSNQPAGYQRTAGHWVMAAKREETRLRRLDALIADSTAGLKIKPLRRPGGQDS